MQRSVEGRAGVSFSRCYSQKNKTEMWFSGSRRNCKEKIVVCKEKDFSSHMSCWYDLYFCFSCSVCSVIFPVFTSSRARGKPCSLLWVSIQPTALLAEVMWLLPAPPSNVCWLPWKWLGLTGPPLPQGWGALTQSIPCTSQQLQQWFSAGGRFLTIPAQFRRGHYPQF